MGVGQRLKEERLRQGPSLEEIEEETKIRKYYLQALEEENFQVLPPQVYATGFVKRYAKFLGLNEAELSEQFKREAYAEEEEAPVIQVNEPLTPINKWCCPGATSWSGLSFLVLAFWIGNYIADYLSDRGNPGSSTSDPGYTTTGRANP